MTCITYVSSSNGIIYTDEYVGLLIELLLMLSGPQAAAHSISVTNT